MLNKFDAIGTIKNDRKDGGPRYTYLFKCQECDTIIKVRSDALKSSTGLCKVHAQQKRPFESIYECLKRDHRGIKVTISYEEYLEFTKQDKCHYCYERINWIPYSASKGEYKSRAYYLDRKNNNLEYSKENCVVCCSKCNRARGNRYTYEEWYGMTEYFRNKK